MAMQACATQVPCCVLTCTYARSLLLALPAASQGETAMNVQLSTCAEQYTIATFGMPPMEIHLIGSALSRCFDRN